VIVTTDDISAVHHRALDATRPLVAGIGADQWDLPTPCADWNVRELLNHMVAGNLWAAQLASGRTIDDVGATLDGDVLGTDPTAAYDASAAAAANAFEAPGALDAPCAVSYGPVPGSIYAGHRLIDVLVHGWDLATATGQSTDLDPQLVAACWDVARPQLSLLQGSGAFGDDYVPAASIDEETQASLLAAFGRKP
jgi:uncharacterized protein (TIGR03086 family)